MKSNFLAQFIQIKTNERQLRLKTLKDTESLSNGWHGVFPIERLCDLIVFSLCLFLCILLIETFGSGRIVLRSVFDRMQMRSTESMLIRSARREMSTKSNRNNK